jgi:hypothetical protein
MAIIAQVAAYLVHQAWGRGAAQASSMRVEALADTNRLENEKLELKKEEDKGDHTQ